MAKYKRPRILKMDVTNLSEETIRERVDHYIPYLKHPFPDVRYSDTSKLGQLKSNHATEPLLEILKDEVWYVREMAAWALGEIRDERAIKPLINLLKDPHEMVRAAAVTALGKFGKPELVTVLQSARRDENGIVRRKAKEVLYETWAVVDKKPSIARKLGIGGYKLRKKLKFYSREVARIVIVQVLFPPLAFILWHMIKVSAWPFRKKLNIGVYSPITRIVLQNNDNNEVLKTVTEPEIIWEFIEILKKHKRWYGFPIFIPQVKLLLYSEDKIQLTIGIGLDFLTYNAFSMRQVRKRERDRIAGLFGVEEYLIEHKTK